MNIKILEFKYKSNYYININIYYINIYIILINIFFIIDF